ncbi:hypothetical protein F5Y19DRAFT_81421 [Xylariaceae sp. FL1651]|nr:hypothetical protein F5Y19DRAFT_81421 [Xylariaceae sp. FL1651]
MTMRLHVAISRLLTCLIGLSTTARTKVLLSPRDGTGITPTSNSVVSINLSDPQPLFDQNLGNQTFTFVTIGVQIEKVQIDKVELRIYDVNESDGQADKIIGTVSLESTSPNGVADAMLSSDDRGFARTFPTEDVSLLPEADGVIIPWDSMANIYTSHLNQPLYLKCDWKNSTNSGDSTSPLFVVYNTNNATAKAVLHGLQDSGVSIAAPARPESISVSSTPTPQSTSAVSPSSTPVATSQSPASAGLQPSSPTPGGLNKKSIIGIAVGAVGAGLLIAGVLLWLFCFRRRRSSALRHGVPSYSPDSGVHAMMPDKEIPVILESSPHSAYGGEGRHSTDPYAPYSDRAPTPSTPPHPRGVTSAAATSQTDRASTRSTASPTPAVPSRYAHLVEEGMTEDEIKQLEEEERHLDVAIENAGRRGTP